MDFALTDEQLAIVELTKQILTDRCTPERLKEVESGTEWFDRETWAELAKAELLGICLPEDVGGGGFGFLEACLMLREAGRTVAPLPWMPTLVAALALAEHGTEDQVQEWIPDVIVGDAVLTLALAELDTDGRHPHVAATPDGDGGWTLNGAKTVVPAAHIARGMVVTARQTDDGEVRVFIVPLDADGVSIERQDTFNHEPQFHVDFSDVAVSRRSLLGIDGDGGAVNRWIVDRATVAVCALAAGITDAGMRITAEYVTGRKQFERPIGSFQAVGHRMADCFVDNEAVNLSMLQAASLLDADRRADAEVAVAKYWASYSGSRVGHAGLHLHGGISIDLDYPIHRYFLTSKHLEYTLGAAGPQLARLGEHLANEPVAT